MTEPHTVVRPARVEDAAAMARVLVQSWQETYRGIMRDEVLDDPDLVARREQFWRTALGDARFAANRAAVAEVDGRVVGVAMSGPPLDEASDADRQLYILYVLAAQHGSGTGSALLDAVVHPTERLVLWVADPNPRAQAFYRKHGFRPDGAHQIDDGVREIRMRRPSTRP